MKGLILSGGKGTRLRPLTYTRAKQLLPLANKPVLFYAIEALVEAGIRELGIVVGDTHEEIRAAVGDGARFGRGVRVTYIQQEAPLGLAHAVLTAQPFLGDDKFIMFLGDNLIGEPLGPIVDAFASPSCAYSCRILLRPVDNPSEFGVAELEPMPSEPLVQPVEGTTPLRTGSRAGSPRAPLAASAAAAALTEARTATPTAAPARTPTPAPAWTPTEARIRRLIEKPTVPPSNLALVGVYCFDTHIFAAASSITPSARGELEITDAIQWLIDTGYDVRPHLLDGYWIDTGKMEDILAANRQVLSRLDHAIDPTAQVAADAVLQGSVSVQAGARIVDSVVRGPAIIGERAVIEHAYVGPFSSIYHDATIVNSEVEYCIVLEHARITDVSSRIEASLIGRYAEVYDSLVRPKAHKLMLGDYSKVSLNE